MDITADHIEVVIITDLIVEYQVITEDIEVLVPEVLHIEQEVIEQQCIKEMIVTIVK